MHEPVVLDAREDCICHVKILCSLDPLPEVPTVVENSLHEFGRSVDAQADVKCRQSIHILEDWNFKVDLLAFCTSNEEVVVECSNVKQILCDFIRPDLVCRVFSFVLAHVGPFVLFDLSSKREHVEEGSTLWHDVEA